MQNLKFTRRGGLVCFCAALLLQVFQVQAADADWTQFRGPGGLGVSSGKPPLDFASDKNVAWSVEAPAGNSSPIVVGDKLLITGEEDKQLYTYCFDKGSGKLLWKKQAPTPAREKHHPLGSAASPTPASDGKMVYVYFGSFGLLAYDLHGEQKWEYKMPVPVVEFGASASPVLYEDKVIQVCDQDLNSFLVALDAATGKEVWKADRSKFRRSFATPFIWKHSNAVELIVPGSVVLTSYNPSDGKLNWQFEGTSRVACSSPAAGADTLISASWNVGGDPGDRVTMPEWDDFQVKHDANKNEVLEPNEIPAGPVKDRFTQIDLDKNNQATREEWENMRAMFAKAGNALLAFSSSKEVSNGVKEPAWKSLRSLPYVASPVVYNGKVYTVKNGGLFSCYDLSSGKIIYQDERLGAQGDYYASLIAGNGHIFACSQQGTVVIIKEAPEMAVIRRIKLGEEIFATPAVSDSTLYIRTKGKLFAFSQVKTL